MDDVLRLRQAWFLFDGGQRALRKSAAHFSLPCHSTVQSCSAFISIRCQFGACHLAQGLRPEHSSVCPTFLPGLGFPFMPLSFAELTRTALSCFTSDCSGGIILARLSPRGSS